MMKPQQTIYAAIETLFVLVITSIILHQIEAGYEAEWELFNLRFGMTGFLLLNIPVVMLPFPGFYWLIKGNAKGLIVAMIAAIGGWVPFFVHIVFKPLAGHFDQTISFVLLFAGAVAGALLLILSIIALARRCTFRGSE